MDICYLCILATVSNVSINMGMQRAFEKIHIPSMIKILKLGREATYLIITKVIYDKPTDNIVLSCERLKSLSSKIKSNTRVSILKTPIQHLTRSLSQSNQAG